ncbi:MAG: FixH family protein [Gemmatimonadaceae bacterium]|nr:FixH family protein [Gemmatimonadaceae bacterium]
MKPGIGWPIGISCILGATIIGNLTVMRIAKSDPAFAIEPDYYRKAVQYDSTMAQERRNIALGWQVVAQVEPINANDSARVVVTLNGPDATPLTHARVAVMARFNARANDTLTAVLTEQVDGQYVTTLPIGHVGEWEIRVDARRDQSHWQESQRVFAVRAAGSSESPNK